ncbi:DUF4148 domain-containing protein [Trinickia caryophylli]|uniref:DUF4148 domain-containing protein n=1 Tax=Trinickia caryophylli TaxID=28094 RepID=A0A1X7H569_TRICW|nr:DUF4148 domain-containing protein [Trinickia caryophylli]PMS09612.1 DUF4148 domain-containing protein [Trinickia caryophylli]TRX17251.1 DUF4148 domain-containing protein [Trinickia caryophylli]WQE12014.1 DUF4148 domain-containing protein [Trinickia caryophylli]SMF79775.1 protein of unknown function [Trinickia caryophylli]
MKSIVKAAAVALVLAAPVASFAQASANRPLTRAEVRADLERVVAAGYRPTDWLHYPGNIQAVEARLAAQDAAAGAAPQADATGVGGVQASAESGRPSLSDGTRSSYSPPVTIYQHN